MLKKKLNQVIFYILFISIFGLSHIHAQQSFNSTGGNAMSEDGIVSYSIGQVFSSNIIGTDGVVSEGVQQPIVISVISEIDKAKNIMLSASLYPNPFIDYLILEIKDYDFSNIIFQLYDSNGQLMYQQSIISNQTKISLNNLVAATYFIRITDKMKDIKTFNIIKN